MGGATRPKCEHGTPGSGPQFGHGTRLLEACASAACSQPGRAGMAPGCPWNMVTVAGFVASSLVLIGRPRYFGGKIARIAALAFSHKLTAASYNIGAPGAPKCPESTRRLGHCPTGAALPGTMARYWRPS